MINLIPRLLVCEESVRQLLQNLGDLVRRVVSLEQNPWLSTTAPGGSSGGPQPGYYCLVPSGGPWGATWTSGVPTTPGSFGSTVYQISGTTVTSLGSQTVRNWFPASPAPSLVIQVFPDGSGGYQTGPQSCT
jgi:hypothetical protein